MTDKSALSNKEIPVEDTKIDGDTKEVTEKHDHMLISQSWLGGATSLEGAFAFLEAREEQTKVDDLMWLFRDVQDNIFSDPEMQLPEKVEAMSSLIDEFSSELTQVKEKTLFVKVKDTIFPRKVATEKSDIGGITLFRSKETNNLEFVAIASNNFRDNDNPPDIITKEAHVEYAEYVKSSGHYPELRLWHTPEFRLGKVSWVEEVNGFLVTGGTVDKEAETLVEKAINEHGFNAISMGFFPIEEKDHIIEMYRTFEVSILPQDVAANPWTSIDLLN